MTLSKDVLATLGAALAYLIEDLGVDRIKVSDIVEESLRKRWVSHVGDLARRQLGDVFWPVREGGEAADPIRVAQRLLENPQTAVEVPMVRDGLFARADALALEGDGFVLQETKASTYKAKDDGSPTRPKAHHLEDIAIQAWVMESTNLARIRCELNLIDSKWVYQDEGDYSGLLRQQDVSGEVETIETEVEGWLHEANQLLEAGRPEVSMGSQCYAPHPCPFQDRCRELEPLAEDHPLELLPGSGKALAKKLREQGYRSLLDPREDEFVGKDAALFKRMQVGHRDGRAVLEPDAAEIINRLPFPRYFFDFEGIDMPVPIWTGTRPYEQIPFQFSCHIEEDAGQFRHEEFLDLAGTDPSPGCMEAMIRVLAPGTDGPIIVYNATYERSRIRELGLRHPEYADLMRGFEERLFDLWPVVRDHYYHPAMRGSFSIKSVLKAVSPDLDYGDLDEIQSGSRAQVGYLEAISPDTSEARKLVLDQSLREYCRLDTWAMVEVAFCLLGGERAERPEED
ncbi:MAG: DUF2779 domain-containing protein [Alphaproteobacteria bacterium]